MTPIETKLKELQSNVTKVGKTREEYIRMAQNRLRFKIDELKDAIALLENRKSIVQDEIEAIVEGEGAPLTLISNYYRELLNEVESTGSPMLASQWALQRNKLEDSLFARLLAVQFSRHTRGIELNILDDITLYLFIQQEVYCTEEEIEAIGDILRTTYKLDEWRDLCDSMPEEKKESKFLEILAIFDKLITHNTLIIL